MQAKATNPYFSEVVLNQIEKYAALWDDQMPSYGLSFRIQYTGNGYRTVVLSRKLRCDIVCSTVKDIYDFSDTRPTPNEGWNPTLLDKFAFMLRNDLTWTADESLMDELFELFKGAEKYNEVNHELVCEVLKKGKLSLNDNFKSNQHPQIIFKAIKKGNRITRKNGKVSLYIKSRKTTEDEELNSELGIDNSGDDE